MCLLVAFRLPHDRCRICQSFSGFATTKKRKKRPEKTTRASDRRAAITRNVRSDVHDIDGDLHYPLRSSPSIHLCTNGPAGQQAAGPGHNKPSVVPSFAPLYGETALSYRLELVVVGYCRNGGIERFQQHTMCL